jgi:uncharacterized protein (DUF2062 family)
MIDWLKKKLWLPLIGLLKQGITPEKLALTVALGSLLGTIPVLGTTTFLCTVAALALRLNLPAIHLVNYAVYPLQLAFFIPFIKIGSAIIGGPEITVTIAEIIRLANENFFEMVHTLWLANLFGLIVWLAAGIPISFFVYIIFLYLFRKALKTESQF